VILILRLDGFNLCHDYIAIMKYLKELLIGLAIWFAIHWWCSHRGQGGEEFCPYGYCPSEHKQYNEFIQKSEKQYPAHSSAYNLGYDNPYIYPYNYGMNQNNPVGRFKYPGWVRQLQLEGSNYRGFPGFGF